MSTEKDWSGMAKDFDKLQDYIVGEETNVIIANELEKLHSMGNVLELGCGNGKYTRQIIHAVNHITATDFSENMVAAATEKLKDFKNVTIEQADCYKLNYKDATFDTVFMANLIHVVLNPELALSEARRVLKKNGRVIIVSFTPDGMNPENLEIMKKRYLEVFGKFPEKKAPMMLNDLLKMVEENNFQADKAELLGNKTRAMYLIANK